MKNILLIALLWSAQVFAEEVSDCPNIVGLFQDQYQTAAIGNIRMLDFVNHVFWIDARKCTVVNLVRSPDQWMNDDRIFMDNMEKDWAISIIGGREVTGTMYMPCTTAAFAKEVLVFVCTRHRGTQ